MKSISRCHGEQNIRLFIILAIFIVTISQVSFAACNKPNIAKVDFATYYASVHGKSGDELKAVLNDVIKGHTRHFYTCAWEMLKEAEEDPQNTNDAIGFYTRRSIPKSRRDQGESDMDTWNREHIWAKSHGLQSESQHAYTDAHYLRAAERSVNTE